jgi:hypothetical protein
LGATLRRSGLLAILHATARVKGGDGGVRVLAELPPEELARVTDLLVKAGDLAAKAIAAGSEMGADLRMYGTLAAAGPFSGYGRPF